METFTITNGDIYTPKHQGRGTIVIEGDKISEIKTEDAVPRSTSKIIDAAGCTIIPGLIDALVHGGGGVDTMTGKVEDIHKIARAHVTNGVTSLVLGISSGSMEQIDASLKAIAHVVDTPIEDGARILGSYVEGKFGSLAKNGAQDARYITPPNFEEFHAMWAASDGTLKVISVAPENDIGATEQSRFQFIKHLTANRTEAYNNIVVAMGHTNATYEQAMAAIDAGVTRATHTYNGMSGMHHRNLGALEAVFAHKGIHAELIVDEQHVHPFWGDILVRRKGIHNVGLITDCTELAGVSPEVWQADATYISGFDAYRLEKSSSQEAKKYVKNGAMWLDLGKTSERLAGANITLMDGIENVMGWGYSLEEALTMATLTPAHNLGIADQLGSIGRGKAADIVILDENFNVRDVFIRGNLQDGS